MWRFEALFWRCRFQQGVASVHVGKLFSMKGKTALVEQIPMRRFAKPSEMIGAVL
jgi:hypothetical protein